MAREKLPAEEIQRVLQLSIDRVQEVVSGNIQVTIPLPQKVSAEQGSCNWSFDLSCIDPAIRKKVAKLRQWGRSQFQLID